jgi:hypothetical protein
MSALDDFIGQHFSGSVDSEQPRWRFTKLPIEVSISF